MENLLRRSGVRIDVTGTCGIDKPDLVLGGGAPARDLGRVRDSLFQAVSAEGSEADAGSAVQRADAPVVGGCGAGAHIVAWGSGLLCDQGRGLVGGGHSGRMRLVCPGR